VDTDSAAKEITSTIRSKPFNGTLFRQRGNGKSGSRYRQVPAKRSDTYQNSGFGAGYVELNNPPLFYESLGWVVAPFDTQASAQN
jgi:hypothetical protein